MKPIFNPWQLDPFENEAFRCDIDYCRKVEPQLTEESVKAATIKEWLEEELESIANRETKTLEQFRKQKTLQTLLDKKTAEADKLWLALRICELIHKHNLTDEVEE